MVAGGTASFLQTNVSKAGQVKALTRQTVDGDGSLDIAFSNAGLLPPTAPLAEQSEDDWNRNISVDVTGVFLCLKYELAHMAKSGMGVIINTASIAGLRADPSMASYAAAKHAVVRLTKAAALDSATTTIWVNVIAPGLAHTPMAEHWLHDSAMPTAVLADSSIRRAIEPADIAGIVLFLTSAMAGAPRIEDGPAVLGA